MDDRGLRRYLRAEDFHGQPIRLSANWVSNGHWGIRRERIVGGELFTKEVCEAVFGGLPALAVGEEYVARLIALHRSIAFYDTGWRKQLGCVPMAWLLSKDQQHYRFVDARYLRLIDMEEDCGVLYGSANLSTALADTENGEPPSFLLMPIMPGGHFSLPYALPQPRKAEEV